LLELCHGEKTKDEIQHKKTAETYLCCLFIIIGVKKLFISLIKHN